METMNLPCKIVGCQREGTTHGDAISSEYALCYDHYQQWFLPEYPCFAGDFITAVNKANAIYCELCSRYGVKTPVTGEIVRELEGEGVTKVYEFAVCQRCADMLDNDKDQP